MPNLEQIRKLNEKYKKKGPIDEYRKTKMFINEGLNIQKAFSFYIQRIKTEYEAYFEWGHSVESVLMFIDVCGFSTRFKDLSGNEISDYFHQYYDIIIPIIYDHGGEIDKIMGDGIICIFAPPFQDESLAFNINEAYHCARNIIRKTKFTKFKSKVAIHCGEVNYFRNRSGLYDEYTIIGKPLTELFRLESISKDSRINFFSGTEIDRYSKIKLRRDNIRLSSIEVPVRWVAQKHAIENLKGVDYNFFQSIRRIRR